MTGCAYFCLQDMFFCAWCKANPSACHSYWHDYNWTVSEDLRRMDGWNVSSETNTTSNNATASNATVAYPMQLEHVIVSTIDIVGTCDSIVVILSLQIVLRSIRSPNTTVLISLPDFLALCC